MFAKLKKQYTHIKSFVDRNQRFVPVFSFFAGFAWDSATVNRIDQLADNIFLALYLVLLAVLIILVQYEQNGRLSAPWLARYAQWYPAAIQFLFGGLFSVYVLFYFRSASFTRSAVFLIILVLIFIANEFLEKKLNNTYLTFGLYFFASFSFFIFFIPVITGIMNTVIFILGSILGIAVPGGVIWFLHKRAFFASQKIFYRHLWLLAAVWMTLLSFYWLNLIPPVPLAMKFSGIYHHASRNQQTDTYTLKYQKPAWYKFFTSDDKRFYYQPSDTVFCFTSVFAPASLTKKIAHKWQYYSEQREEWLVTDRSVYQLSGGRDGGYRGYTFKKNMQEGEWRIDIVTDEDLILGRLKMRVIASEDSTREFIIIEK